MQNHGWKRAAVIAACVAAPALAWAGQTAPAPPANSEKVTVTGCVERADQVIAGNAVGTTVDSLTFVLMKAEEGKAEDRPARPSNAPATAFDKSYRLDVDVDTINPHVGHRVEIVGIVPSAAQVPVGTSGTAQGGAPPPLLKVESVKMLSSTCSR